MDLSGIPSESQALLSGSNRADNAISHSMTPDDIAGVLKERKGVPITIQRTGKVADHVGEVNGAVKACTNHVNDINKRLDRLSQQHPVPEREVELLKEKRQDVYDIQSRASSYLPEEH